MSDSEYLRIYHYLNTKATKNKQASMHVKICLLYNIQMVPAFTFFKALLKFTPLLTNAFIICGFKAFGWVRNRILPTAYETHTVEQGSEAQDALSSLHVSSHTNYVLFSTPSLFLSMC